MADDKKTSRSPFTVIDNAGVQQKIKVAIISNGSEETKEIAGFSFVEATGSTYEDIKSISGSVNALNGYAEIISNSLIDYSTKLSNISSSVSQSTEEVIKNTNFTEQDLRFKRATHLYSKTFKKIDLFDSVNENIPFQIDLHTTPQLNPAAVDSTYALENYISKAIEVVIQNCTNKNLFLKASYDPSATVSESDYTIKIPPGVIYNSETKISHMRHKIAFSSDSYNDLVGEIATSIVYNTNLNHDLSIGQTFTGEAVVTSIATNYFIIPFTPADIKSVISEWNYSNTSGYDSMKITGQARVAKANQKLTLYVTKKPDNTKFNNQFVEITSLTPTVFDLSYPDVFDPLNPGLQSGDYELIAEVSGSGELGDARVLFADLIKYTTP